MTNSQVVRAFVSSVHPYGVVVQVGGEQLLVHAHDQSWYWPYNALLHSQVGDECDVWVGDLDRYGSVTRVASFRLVHPELDPRNRVSVGSTISGRVMQSNADWVSVHFGPAQFADFHISDLRTHGVQVGKWTQEDVFHARVASVEPEGPTIVLESAS